MDTRHSQRCWIQTDSYVQHLAVALPWRPRCNDVESLLIFYHPQAGFCHHDHQSWRQMPAGTLTLATKDGPQKVSAEDYFKGKKVVLFSVPGAFTPTCDAKHLPGFVEKAAELQGQGCRRPSPASPSTTRS